MSLIRPNFAELFRRSQSPRVGTRPDPSVSPATEDRISADPDAPEFFGVELTPLALAPGYAGAEGEATPACYVERGRVWLCGVVSVPADAADGELMAMLPDGAVPSWTVRFRGASVDASGGLHFEAAPETVIYLEGASYSLAQLPPGFAAAYGNYPHAEDYPHSGSYPYPAVEIGNYPHGESYPHPDDYPY